MVEILLFIYLLIMMIGAASFLAAPFSKQNPCLRLILGFSLFPMMVTYGGHLFFFRIPYMSQLLGGGFFVFGIYFLWARRKYFHLRVIHVFPALMLLTLFISKFCYLFGSVNNSDEIRSLLLTGSFSANFLKPAFPFDFSLPLSYSHYLYETCAFLYSAIGGHGFPSLPILVVNLLVVGLFYQALYLISEHFFKTDIPKHYIFLCLFITFYGFDGFMPVVYHNQHIEWWNNPQITGTASYFHWVFQYLWGATLLLLAFMYQEKKQWMLALCLYLLASGFAAITFVWAVPMALTYALFKREIPNIKEFPKLVGLTIIFVLPVSFAFIGRDVISTFTFPHLWFKRAENAGIFENIWILCAEWGPFLLLGAFLALKDFKSIWGTVAIVSILLMTFTESSYFDWGTRGIMLFSFVTGFYASQLITPRVKKLPILLITIFLLIPQAYSFYLENYFRFKNEYGLSPAARNFNKNYSLDSLFYSKERISFYDLIFAGRAYLGSNNDNYIITYKNNEAFLERYIRGQEADFIPCRQTSFGNSVPTKHYYEISGPDLKTTPKKCP